MTLKKNTTYNYNTNLLKASEGKDIESVIKQWEIIYEEKREHQDGLCICQKKVKNIIYMYNINTTNTIIVGSSCRKKFNMENNKISNKILKVLFKNNLIKGEYVNIDNIITYCNSVQEQLLHHIQKEFECLFNKYIEDKKDWDNNDDYLVTNNWKNWNHEEWNKWICYELKNKKTELSCKILNYEEELNNLFINVTDLICKYKLQYLEEVNVSINKLIEEIKFYKNNKIYSVNWIIDSEICLKNIGYINNKHITRKFHNLKECDKHISKEIFNNNDTMFTAFVILISDEINHKYRGQRFNIKELCEETYRVKMDNFYNIIN